MKKCSQLIKDITNYMSCYGDIEIFIDNDEIKPNCKHDAKIIERYDGYSEGKNLICSKCGTEIGRKTCFGKTVIY